MNESGGSRLVFGASFVAAALGAIAGLVVALTNWSHGDEPVIIFLLVAGSFVCLYGAGLSVYAARRKPRLAPLLAAVLNVAAFVFLSIFWRLF